ncbi:peptidoglycan-binding protein [Streptomyces leeuwenhoekii]|uniref:Peptidoglycan-binding protein n=1 Tax=Streptomyces leeuwenhoekii TaxID=1437453 RepID=A0ABR5HVB9_STRLW|nr:WXG100 family type VII secretion target [Streptomyces leeuwenhoekii]KMS77488.1 peptidoglycan-binding protein [Streptomyces leeuwenhoekii]
MAGESTTSRRSELAGLKGSIQGADDKNGLIEAIRKSLDVKAPVGDPGAIEAASRQFKQAVSTVDEAAGRIGKAASGLPAVWTGTTQVAASDVVAAARRAADQMREAFEGSAKALTALADGVSDAQQRDRVGCEVLREALSSLGGEDGFFDGMWDSDEEDAAVQRARTQAADGVERRHQAAVIADDAARKAAGELNRWASDARSGKLEARGLTAADKLMLADTSSVSESGPDREYNEILSANDLERSAAYMNKMSPEERAELERMLKDSKSPEERAYLMKTVAAGYDMDEVREFRQKIHPYGDDEAWLRRHLSPAVTEADSRNRPGAWDDLTYNGQNWSQKGNTCVPGSTIGARAMVDPVYALELTGGPSGQEDDGAAFRRRLDDELMRVHEEGDGSYDSGFWWGAPDGMDSDGQNEVANAEISPHTGAEYEYREIREGADARRDVLPDIERAVADGKPVPIEVEGKDANGDRVGHQMMIIGQEGDMLQVYNPWGHTTWVSEDDFVNGRMDKASDERLPNAFAVHVPK